MQIKVKVWIEDDEENLVFGGGKTQILEHISQTGSISKASSNVGMNYRKAWSHLKVLEKYIEDELVICKKGQGEGSGTTLTPKAQELVNRFRELNNEVREFTKDRFEELFFEEGNEILTVKGKEKCTN